MCLILLVVIFEKTVFTFCKDRIKFLRKIRYSGMNKAEALSNDLLEEIHVSYIVNDYKRTALEIKTLQEKINQVQPTSKNSQTLKTTLQNHVKALEAKLRMLERKIDELCKLVGVSEGTLEERMLKLKRRQLELLQIVEYRMMSKVQSYDIRDCQEYFGILELERILKSMKNSNAHEIQKMLRKSESRVGAKRSNSKSPTKAEGNLEESI
jgi:hypothetical protein